MATKTRRRGRPPRTGPPSEKVQVTIRAEIASRLRRQAEAEGRTRSAIIERALTHYWDTPGDGGAPTRVP